MSARTRAARGVAACIAALGAVAAPGHAQTPLLTLPAVPWFVGQNVAPNLLLTLDDSGSMAAAYVPDAFPGTAGAGSLAMKSNLNPMYYNPAVEYVAPPDADGLPYPTSFGAARRNGFDASRGTVDLASAYRPEQTYSPNATTASHANHCTSADLVGGLCPGVGVASGVATGAYWWTYRAGGGCPAAPTLAQMKSLGAACFAFGRPANDAERQNFANWYSFYRTRNLATVSAAMRGFSRLPRDYRVAWQGLHSCSDPNAFSNACRGWDPSVKTVDARIGAFDAAQRADLWRWLERLPASGGTPLHVALKRAGEYLRDTGPHSPFRDEPGDPKSGMTSCRASYGVTMTDGIWNERGKVDAGNADATTRKLPDGRTYRPRAPFRDDHSNSLADLAFQYWSTDLQPDLNDTLRPFLPFTAGPVPDDKEYWDPRNDPATWQRMNGIFVGLGLSSWLTDPPWAGSTFAGAATVPPIGYAAFASGGAPWPATGPNAAPGNVYDLWHAAINSRGHFYSADSPEALVRAFDDLRERISQREAGVTAAAASSLQVQAGSMLFGTSFSSARWDGTLRAWRTAPDGKAEATPAWSTDSTFNALGHGILGNPRVLTRGKAGTLVPFTPAGLGALPAERIAELDAQATALGVCAPPPGDCAATLVRWVLGDASRPELRRRDRLLGDLVNSPPAFEGGRDYGYGTTAWTDDPRIDGPVYARFLERKKRGMDGTPAKPTVYVGSNDGMLHAFDTATGALRFSFLPTPSIAKLGRRADPMAGHTWFVDGPIALHDVHLDGEWRSILVASTGAGTPGLFALDITDPDAPRLLWEWFPDDPDLGHVLGEPVIARAESGEWIVAVGNGYGSAANTAHLYVLDAGSGALHAKVRAGGASPRHANGLSGPALLYLPGRRLAAAFAGDLRGNLWRFELRGAPADWRLSNANKPIFSATGPDGEVQPITAKPRIATDRTLGRVLMFGTGRLLTLEDRVTEAVQSVYGIFDRNDGLTTARAELTAQSILSEADARRTVSAHPPAAGSAGWRLDLTGTSTTRGERVVLPVVYLPEASIALVTSTRPIASTDACSANVGSWLMTLSPFSGRAIALFKLGEGDAMRAGLMLENTFAAPTVMRAGAGRLRVLVNNGSAGLFQYEIVRPGNPRAAWQQVR